MSKYNLSKSIFPEGMYGGKPTKSSVEAGENCSNLTQKLGAKYTRSGQRNMNAKMAFGNGVNLGSTATYTHSPRTPSDSSLEITMRLQQQVAKENNWLPKERRGIDDTHRGKGLTMLGGFIERPQSHNGICDTEIHVDKEAFRVHRAILSCYSSYFSNLFSKEVGKRKLPIIVRMSGISSESFRVFLNFVYDRVFNVSYGNVQDVMKTADVLGIPVLKNRCLHFLEHTSLDNAIKILRRSRYSPESAMFKFLVSRISENFPKLHSNKEFLELDAPTVCWILSDDNIKITKEMDVFILAMKWIIHSRSERQKDLSEVLSCIRFMSMNQDELFDCFEISDMVKASAEVRNAILVSNWVLTAGALKRRDPLQVPRVAPRNCLIKTRHLAKKTTSAFFSTKGLPGVRVAVELGFSQQFVDRHHGRKTAHSTGRQQPRFYDSAKERTQQYGFHNKN